MNKKRKDKLDQLLDITFKIKELEDKMAQLIKQRDNLLLDLQKIKVHVTGLDQADDYVN
jgi:hypothetical protein